MLTNFIIVEKLAGRYGQSDIRVVQGTEMIISKGQLQIWNSEREVALSRRPVVSVPVKRVVSFKQQTNKSSNDSSGGIPVGGAQLRLQTNDDEQTQVA